MYSAKPPHHPAYGLLPDSRSSKMAGTQSKGAQDVGEEEWHVGAISRNIEAGHERNPLMSAESTTGLGYLDNKGKMGFERTESGLHDPYELEDSTGIRRTLESFNNDSSKLFVKKHTFKAPSSFIFQERDYGS
ncbi:unnamed protein product [Protopolystoma xenopodis]|uniref:Uncharacterized protein n=1 Tax=Protopolystoma xenopodis TaxID=117903 RepID=A0A448XFY5_9PLAT|nr:unnamed protein product [Protopolystoma xenopodis]